jgi:glutamate synthase (NADPH/NADH) large chain/glutamate synthase (ferredoxin)
VHFADLPPSEEVTLSGHPLHTRQLAFGYTQEDLRVLLTPMAEQGLEPIGSMGNDLSLAVLSDQAPPLFSYFKQLFAQVTNPPIDPIREEIVMSLATTLGTERNLFEETPEHAHKLVLERPILLNRELETLRHISHDVFSSRTIDITWPVTDGLQGMQSALARACEQAHQAISEGVNIIILSDRHLSPHRAPIPSLLAVAAVHHHLVREGTRLRAGIVLESGEPREVHHFATLIGYGASAINPYVMLETLDDLVFQGHISCSDEQAAQNALKAVGKGLLKTHISQAPPHASAASGRTSWRARHWSVTPVPGPDQSRSFCQSAASMPGVATGSTISGTPRRSHSCSTPSVRITETWKVHSEATVRRRSRSARAPRFRSSASTQAPSTRTPHARRHFAACCR